MDYYKNAIDILEKYSENTAIEIIKKLKPKDQEILAKQILKTNFEQIEELYKNKNNIKTKFEKIEPIECIDKSKLDLKQRFELENIGGNIVRNNQFAVVTMAGGQGTRLGHSGPKGTYKLDIGGNGKYIFEIFVQKLLEAKKKYGTEIYWYIMTSEENNDETIIFFENHNYFGYNKQKVKFFKQSIIPVIDENGKILIDNKYNIKTASDGNGGIYKALEKNGIISEMKQNGIKWVQICGVDNIMINMVDPIAIGLAEKTKIPCISKSIKKQYPEEKVGVFCKKNGKPGILEYIEMTEKLKNEKYLNGELVYQDSNIISHLFEINSLEKLAKYNLEYHYAHKKGTYINENLQEIIPNKPNIYKFEAFIFDGFKYLENMIVLRVKREEEFAPIKNKEGVDSPETAKKIYEEYYKVKK